MGGTVTRLEWWRGVARENGRDRGGLNSESGRKKRQAKLESGDSAAAAAAAAAGNNQCPMTDDQ